MKDGPRLSSIIADWSSIDSIKSRSKIWTRPRVALRAKSALGARVRVTLGVALEMKPAGLLLPFRFRFQPRPHSDWSAIQKRPITSRLPPFFLSDVLTQGPHKKKGKKRRIVAILKCLFFPVCLFLVHRKRGTNRSKWKRNRERERNRKESTSSRSITSMSLKFSAFLLNSGGIDDEIPFLPVLSIVYRVLPGFLICPYFYYGLT